MYDVEYLNNKHIYEKVDKILEENKIDLVIDVRPPSDGNNGFSECTIFNSNNVPVATILFTSADKLRDYCNYVIEALETALTLAEKSKNNERFIK